MRSGFTPCFANVAKLSENEKLRRGALLRATVYGLLFGSLFCLIYYIWQSYHQGAIYSERSLLRDSGRTYYQTVVYAMENLHGPHEKRLLWGGIGMALMAILTIGRYNLAWWPLHPIGLPIGPTWTGQTVMLSFFVAWLAKTLIIRMGGVPLFIKAKPFFFGLLIGHLVAVGVGYLVDCITGPPGLTLYF
ncbi:MAG: hypothetical protein BWZ10_01266 [candidate division BRC1 bacterium ADurb.BinA364]|nr:MAG: hypothetical protein BWZ10_01266 [candidate division BRC1 bacterium ADurb.BinA364]